MNCMKKEEDFSSNKPPEPQEIETKEVLPPHLLCDNCQSDSPKKAPVAITRDYKLLCRPCAKKDISNIARWLK